jgi:carbonic anhydrase
MKYLILTLLSVLYIRLLKAQLQCPADKDEAWTYRERKGPKYWGESHPQCYGDKQSPIDIYSETAVKDENLAQLDLENYDTPLSAATIENNGHTIEVRPSDDVERTISVNGDTYTLRQFHFHWGKTYADGSEHTLDDVQYAMELHFVHMNSEDKAAVVGIFFEEQDDDNDDLKPIVDQLKNVRFKGTESHLASELDLNSLLPSNPTSYYRYEGSLTTPGCAEIVTWSVVPEPMGVGKAQMAEFRKLSTATEDKATSGCKMAGNYRPPQPLNGRQVLLSQ